MDKLNSDFLYQFGWNDFFESYFAGITAEAVVPARIISEERGLYKAQYALDRVVFARVKGRHLHHASSREDYPAVGDWVALSIEEKSDRSIIVEVLPRKSVLKRKSAGDTQDIQILSTNIDFAFITTSLNEDLNYKRIERYLTMIWDSKAIPVILLTKADLAKESKTTLLEDVQERFMGVDVHMTSVDSFEKSTFIGNYFNKGKTSVFLGSSGVGKSTLVNYLIGQEVSKTQDIREGDDKGKHTTTSRSLYQSRFGGLVIDTPGMRELQLLDQEDGLDASFTDIEELMLKCKFTNCKHISEPGCAIKNALENKIMSEDRWESYLKLQSEIQYQKRKQSKVLASEEKSKWKKIHMQVKQNSKLKKR